MRDINLLPEDEKTALPGFGIQKGDAPGISAAAAIASVVAVVFLVLLFFTPRLYAGLLEVKLSTIENELKTDKYKELRNINSQTASIEAQVKASKDIINAVDKNIYSASGVLSSLLQALPKGCIINSVHIENGVLKVTGKAEHPLQEAEFLANMNSLGYYSSYEATNEAKPEKRRLFEYSFSIGNTGRKDGK